MANNFNLNDNKESFFDEMSQTTIRGNFSNNAMALMCNGIPNSTPNPITFTVTFNNADNNGGTSTYTAQPFESIGKAIENENLQISNYSPTYYFNESIVGIYTEIPIKTDISINVKWNSI